MKKIIVFVFTVIMVSSFSILLAADAPAKLEAKLKAYFSEKISTANITTVKVVKLGDIYRAKRQNMFNNNIVEDIERPVLVNIKGKCKYSAKIIDENVKQIMPPQKRVVLNGFYPRHNGK